MLDIGRRYDSRVGGGGGGGGARVWSLIKGKNMCHIYTHYLTSAKLPQTYAQKKKFSQYRHCVQLFCRTVFILTKTLPNMKFI